MKSPNVLPSSDPLRKLSPTVLLLGTLIAVIVLVVGPGANAAGGPVPGIGIVRWGESYHDASGYDRYSYVSVTPQDAALAGALPTKSLVYMSGTSVQTSWSTGVPYQEALANNWLLKDASGQYVRNVAYGAYVGDIGNLAYQQRWVDNVAAVLSQNGNEGVFIDDVIATPVVLTNDVWPAKYPTQQSWEDAMVAFIAKIGRDLRARGFYVLAHANGWLPGDPDSNSGLNNVQFWQRLAPHVSALESEDWVQDPTNPYRLRASGPAWYQQWDGHLAFADAAQSNGADFFALMYGSTTTVEIMRYAKASFLLVWDGSGGALAYEADGDPWNAEWTADIGQPAGARFQVGVGWRREYTNGTAIVNPSPSVSQTFALGGTYTRADGTAVTSVTLAPTTGLVLKKQAGAPPPPPPPPANTGLPAITGTPQQGATLGASPGTWSNSPTGYAYQWKRCDTAGANCTPLAGSTAAQYTLGAGDVGKTMRVTVTATNAGGSASATSNATGVVGAAPPPPPPPPPTALPPAPTAPPVITGTAQERFTLSASNGSWSNAPTGFTYQWKRCDTAGANCASIAGGTGSSFVLTTADVGKTMRVTVTATNAAGSASATSAATEVVAAAPRQAPKISERPTISGSPQDGQALTATAGTWSNSPKWYAFQWRRCNRGGGGCVNIAGATTARYVVAAADAGSTVRVVVAAANDVGVSYARTDSTDVVPPRDVEAPVISLRPTISGNPWEGLVLTASTGTWSNSPTTFAYQWRRCDSEGNACVSIVDATRQTRLVTAADVGWTLRVVVSASNAAGTSYARSEATPLVAPRPVAPPSEGPDA